MIFERIFRRHHQLRDLCRKGYESDTVGNIAYVTDGILKSESIHAGGYAQIGDEYFMVHIDHGKVTAGAEQPDMSKISHGRSVKMPKISTNSRQLAVL